jgi:hypothetical protein
MEYMHFAIRNCKTQKMNKIRHALKRAATLSVGFHLLMAHSLAVYMDISTADLQVIIGYLLTVTESVTLVDLSKGDARKVPDLYVALHRFPKHNT